MGTPLAVNQRFRITAHCSLGNQVSANVMDWLVISLAGAPIDADNLAQSFSGLLAPLYKALLANTAKFLGVKAQCYDPFSGIPGSSQSGSDFGTAGANALPPFTAGLIQKRTAAGGRRGRGRMYVPFPSTTDNNANGEPTTGYLGRLGDLSDALVVNQIATGPGGSATLRHILHASIPTVTNTVTSMPLVTEWATIRRRSFLRRGDTNPFV